MSHQLSKKQYRYTPDSGTVPVGTTVLCGVCGEPTHVKRNLTGPRTIVESMCRNRPDAYPAVTPYDEFCCPSYQEAWHNKIVAMRRWLETVPSQTIQDIVEADIIDLLAAHRPNQITLRYTVELK